nr:MAG TPA: helicase [Bacteriophage sp.]
MNDLAQTAQSMLQKSSQRKDELKQSDAYKFLNGKQFEAVSYPNESFLVLAGAGAGKTSVLINRIRYAIEELKIDPKRIMAVTFTNRAGKEIRSRLYSAFKNTPEVANQPTVGTFHSICYSFIRDHAGDMGLSSKITIWDEEDIKDALVKFASEGYDRPESLMDATERLIARNAVFVKPKDQVAVILNAVGGAYDRLTIKRERYLADYPRETRTEEQRLIIARLDEQCQRYKNVWEYYSFLENFTSGAKTMQNGDKSRLNIGGKLLGEIMNFKERGWTSGKANQENFVFFDSEMDPEIGHYIPTFMYKGFDDKYAIRYMALVVFKDYETYSNDNHLMDFADLLLKVVDAMKTNPTFRSKIQNKYDMIMVDEFQDTNTLQYEWLKLLKSPNASVMVVGDDDQSIYGWRGAHPEYMQYFLYDFQKGVDFQITDKESFIEAQKRFTPLEIVKLEQNYRSTANILQAANDMIALNIDRLGKTLFTKKNDENVLIDTIAFKEEFQQARWIAKDIKDKIEASRRAAKNDPNIKPLNYNDFAVLYRTNMLGTKTSSIFSESNVPHVVYGGYNFYARSEVKTGLEWLNFLLDLDNDLLFEKTFLQIAPTKRTNPYATCKEEQGFIKSMLDELDFERRRSNLGRYIDALVSIEERYRNEVAVMTGDFSEVEIGPDWISPYAVTKGMISSEFHHDKKALKAAKSIAHYARYLSDMLEVLSNDKLSLIEGVTAIWRKCGFLDYYESKALIEEEQENSENAKKKGKTTNLKKVLDAKNEWQRVNELLGQIKQWEEDMIRNDDKGTFRQQSFVDRLSLYLHDVALYTDKEAAKAGEVDLVKLMTIHSSKGLEFNHVYLIGVTDKIFPLGDDIEEERRLFYVGITRARKHLTISHHANGSDFFREFTQHCFTVTNEMGIFQETDDFESQAKRNSPYLSKDGSSTGVQSLQNTVSQQGINRAKAIEKKRSQQWGNGGNYTQQPRLGGLFK